MKTIVGLVSAGLVLAVVLTLYLSGPSIKASGAPCRATRATTFLELCIREPGTDDFAYIERTSAWERFKGAITGNP